MSNGRNYIPEDWQKIQDEYNQPQEEGNTPLFVAPNELGNVSKEDVTTKEIAPEQPSVMNNNINQAPVSSSIPDLEMPSSLVDTSALESLENTKSPLSKQEQLLQDYKDLIKKDEDELKSSRQSDRNLKIGGAIGDALATMINAKGQMNVMAPGVAVQQGAGLGKIADIFQTAPQVEGDMKRRREDLLAQYKSLADGKAITPYQQAYLDMQLGNQGLRKQSLEGTEKRHGEKLEFGKEKFDHQKKEGDELKPKEAESLYALESTLDDLGKLEELRTFSTGPIEGRIQQAMRYLGQGSGKKAALASQLEGIVSIYGKQISGTAVGEKEFERIKAQLPRETDSDEIFTSRLVNFKERMENSRARFMDHYSKAGRDVSRFEKRDSIGDIKNPDSPKESNKDSKKSPPIGSIITSKGKRYKVTSEKGDLEEIK